MKPLISVVVPVYNEEKSIKKCLDFLMLQNYPKKYFEIILVDNNCKDKTVEIARKYPVRIVKEKKQGLTHARIRGVSASLSPIVAFVDSDTQVSSNWLSVIDHVFKEDDRVVGIGFSGNLQPKNLLIWLVETFLGLVNKINRTLPGYCFAFRKNAYLKVGGYDPKVGFGEDVYITKKLKGVGRTRTVDGMATTSSRRYLSFTSLVNYGFKALVSTIEILVFDRSSVKLTPVDKE